MNKPELIRKVARKEKLPLCLVERVLNSSLEEVIRVLSTGETVNLRGFGKWETKERGGRNIRSPRTGKKIYVETHTIVRFTPGVTLKSVIKQLNA